MARQRIADVKDRREVVLCLLHHVSAFAIVALVWIGFGVGAAAQDDLEVVKQLRASINAADHLSLSVASTTSSVNVVEDYGMPPGRRLSEVVRCGDREKVSTYFLMEATQPESDYYKYEYLIDAAGAVFGAQALFDRQGKQRPLDDSSSNLILLLSDKRLVPSAAALRDRRAVYNALEESGTAIWNIGRSPLLDYLKDGNTRPSLAGDGTTLSATGVLGKIVLQLSRDHGWLPHTFVIEKNADSLIGDISVRALFSPRPLPPGLVIPKGTLPQLPKVEISSMSWRGDVAAFAQTADGVWYPAELKLVYRTQFANGRINTATSQVKVEPIPDAAASCDLTIDIPARYRVSIDGAPQLPYRWDGTHAEPGVPDLPKVAAYKPVPVPVRRSYRLLLIVVNLAIIAAILVAIYFSRKRSAALK